MPHLLPAFSSAIIRRHFSSKPKLPSLCNVPSKHRHRAFEQAQSVIVDYLHATRTFPFTYADQIVKNSQFSVSQIVSKVKYSASTFPGTIRKFLRHKCSACFKQYKKKEHLVEHVKISYHSVHQPKCGVCQKHCKSFESLREHLTDNCSKTFYDQGCNLCMRVFDCPITRSVHKWSCCLPAPTPLGTVTASYTDALINASATARAVSANKELEAIAMDCEMVGGGNDGSIGVCARVCLIDEDENVFFHTYVKPEIVVTDYRSKVTGLTEEHLRDAMPLKEVQEKVRDILDNADKILVGHSLEYDLACLKLEYPEHLIRDTATYPPLMKTNLVSHSLKYLANTYLGYDIQYKIHDPYEDTVSVMRLYKRLRDQDHQTQLPSNGGFDAYQMEDLVKMSPDELYEISRSGYRCWCLDRVHPWQL